MPRINNLQDYIDVTRISALRNSGNMYADMTAATELAAIEQNPPRNIACTVRDKIYRHVGEPNYTKLEFNFPRLLVGTGNMRMMGSDPLAEHVLDCDNTVVPVVIDLGREPDAVAGPLRWSGRVDVAEDSFGDPDEDDYIDCQLIHDKVWLTRVVAWPWPHMPLQLQGPPSRGVAFGNAVTVIKYLFGSQFLRIQLGLHDLLNNLLSLNLDWRTFFADWLMTGPPEGPGLDMRDIIQTAITPVYIVPPAPMVDTSPFIELDWRMDELLQLVTKVCEDNGLTIEVGLWEPGMPQPDVWAESVPGGLLQVPTIVVDIKDRRGVTGFSGTWLDGLQVSTIDLLGSFHGEALKPFLNPGNEYAPRGVNIAPALGVHYILPWVVFNCDHPLSGVQGKVFHHHAIAWRTITGGKSPKWLNDLIDATTTYMIDMIMIVVGITGVPGTILQGLFHDVAFAFQLTDNFDRRLENGPFALPEKFFPTGSGSYTLEAFFQQRTAQYDTAGYVSGLIIVDNAFPYEIARDTFPGAQATYIRRGKLFTDWIEDVKVIDDREENVAQLRFQIGDGKAEEAPSAKLQRRLAGIQQGVNIALLAQ